MMIPQAFETPRQRVRATIAYNLRGVKLKETLNKFPIALSK